MKAVVVYESLWGNTAAIAEAIAAGLGDGTRALSTADATPDALARADLIVAGAPVLGFALPTERMRESIGAGEQGAPKRPDLASPSMRGWMASLAAGSGRAAAFETAIWWSPGGSRKTILRVLADKGFRPAGKGERFIVTDRYGPLKDGEVERAQEWGASLRAEV